MDVRTENTWKNVIRGEAGGQTHAQNLEASTEKIKIRHNKTL
jgi:hypothetical protein